MESKKTGLDWTILITRWLARGLSVLSIGTLAMFVAHDVPTPSRVTFAEGLALMFFPLGVVIGMIVAWKWEGIGSSLGLTSLALFYGVYRFLLSNHFPTGWWFLIFSLPLFIFLATWIVSRTTPRRNNADLPGNHHHPTPVAG